MMPADSTIVARSLRIASSARLQFNESAKLNALNPQHYLADVLARIADHAIQDLDQLLPWNWNPNAAKLAA